MARLFNDSGATSLTLADITSARFLDAETWTIIAFARFENVADDERNIFSKWAQSSVTRQFSLNTDNLTAPTTIQVQTNNGLSMTGGTVIELNTWYVVSVSNDGAQGLTLNTFDVAANSFVDDALTGTKGNDRTNLTADLRVGAKGPATGSDPHDGDTAFVAYFNTELTQAEIKAYAHNPYSVVFSKGASGVEFFLPIDGNNSPEPELVHGRNFTVNGSLAKGTNPPIGPLAPAQQIFTPGVAGPAPTRRVFVIS